MRWYVAGPMTGLPHHNFPAFDRAKALLEAHDHEVTSPADIDRAHGIDGSLASYPLAQLIPILREEIDAIFTVDGLYMLAGWERSEGARVEHALAVLLRKKIVYES